MAEPGQFKNRIIGYGTKPADQFQPNEANFRMHPESQRAAVRASLGVVGWISAVIENVTTGNLIDGHERVWQALPGNEEVPFLLVELSEEEERLALATFDPIGEMARTDRDMLASLRSTIDANSEAVRAMLGDPDDAGAKVARLVAGQDSPVAGMRRVTLQFSLSKEDAATVEEAIEEAGKLIGKSLFLERRSAALLAICHRFMEGLD